MENKNVAEVDDLMTVAYLYTIGFRFVGRGKDGKGYTTFIFNNEEGKIDKAIQDYLAGDKVRAIDFVNAYRQLKRLYL